MSKHVHADLMLQYAQDAQETDKPWERWEVFGLCGWGSCRSEISWSEYAKYRRKDPYREFKEKWERREELGLELWVSSSRGVWMLDKNPEWSLPPDRYEFRPKPKRMEKRWLWNYETELGIKLLTEYLTEKSAANIFSDKRCWKADLPPIEVEVDE
jgi:hypothetical protein